MWAGGFCEPVDDAVGGRDRDVMLCMSDVGISCTGSRFEMRLYDSVPVMALRISVAAASLISREACSLYQAVCGVQIRFGASFSGP